MGESKNKNEYIINFDNIYSVKKLREIDDATYLYLMSQGIRLFKKTYKCHKISRLTYDMKMISLGAASASRNINKFSDAEKSIFIGYAMFEDDTKFINFLLRNGYTLNFLKKLSILIDKVVLNNNLAKRTNRLDSVINSIPAVTTLAVKVNKQYGLVTVEEAINRINELIAFKEEIFIELENNYLNEKRSVI